MYDSIADNCHAGQ